MHTKTSETHTILSLYYRSQTTIFADLRSRFFKIQENSNIFLFCGLYLRLNSIPKHLKRTQNFPLLPKERSEMHTKFTFGWIPFQNIWNAHNIFHFYQRNDLKCIPKHLKHIQYFPYIIVPKPKISKNSPPPPPNFCNF